MTLSSPFNDLKILRRDSIFSNISHNKIVTVITFFAILPLVNRSVSQKLDLFFGKFAPVYFRKGEVILRADDVPSGVFYLKKGYVRDYTTSAQGEELTLIIFKPDDIFPIQWVINQKPSEHYFETLTPVEIWKAPREQFVKFLKNNADVFEELTSRIVIRLGGLLTRMKQLAFGNAFTKVVSILQLCAERFGKKEKGEIIIQVPLTHEEIASLVGIKRETASRELKKLELEGLITHRDHLIVVKNLERLGGELR